MAQTATLGLLKGADRSDWRQSLAAGTIADLVRLRANSLRKFHFLDDRGSPTTMTFADVARGAGHYATVLADRGIRRGDRVVIMLPTCPEYLYTFFGAILAGAIPVPVYPPFNPNQLKSFLTTLKGVFVNSEARALIYWQDVRAMIGEALDSANVEVALSLADFGQPDLGRFSAPDILVEPGDTAMLQYTSGSTDAPKGVELTHLNLLHNVEGVRHSLGLVPGEDRVVSWLPLYHDMGLIGVMIGAIYSHIDLVLLAPQSFLMRPKLWL
ncbi:MAG: AMP-binding protein, partial [Cyanobacteria bacterium REEB65]|nr:AMP-binding protein [Cyanobacteria bacterium REEB65]